jgi:YVTN family beta-propeller protein
MRPVVARRVGGVVIGLIGAGVLVGVTAVIVRAGRDLQPTQGSGCPRPSIRGPGLTRIPIGGSPLSVVADGESIWVMRESGSGGLSIVRIDTGTDAVEGQPIPLPEDSERFAVLGGSLWVTVAPPTPAGKPIATGSVLRISETTGRVVSTIPVGRAPYPLAAGFGAVWVVNSADGTVSRIDPATNRVVAIIAAGDAPSRVVIGAGAVWVTTQGAGQGTTRIDPRSNSVVTRIPSFHTQTIDEGIAWGSGAVAPNGGIVKLDPKSNRIDPLTYASDIAPTTVVAHGGRVWVGRWFYYCRQHEPVAADVALVSFELFQLDPVTMKPLTRPFTIAFGPAAPTVSADGALWVADPSLGNDVLRIDPDLSFSELTKA